MAGNLKRKAKQKKTVKAYAKAEKSYKAILRKKISQLKGRSFSGWFKCELCNVNHSKGYLYLIDGEEYEICKFCNDKIFGKSNYVRIIYTPMGNNQ